MFDDSVWGAVGAIIILALLAASVIFGFAFDVDREEEK